MSNDIADNTPILVGAGQVVQRDVSATSAVQLAALASEAAIRDCGVSGIASQIDTISVTRLFPDMGKFWASKWGRSNNPPQSIARRIGADPLHRIYTQTGGNEPQSRVIEFAADIARGERKVVLLSGAEALKNQRSAEREGLAPDWNEAYDEALEDRGMGESVATRQEVRNGMSNVIYYYALIEQAQRQKLGRTVEQHRAAMAQLLESFSRVAIDNPYAQFEGFRSAQDILEATSLSHLYTRNMIARDGVNQGAALLMCSVGMARELGIAESRWVFIHGMAEGRELDLSCRDDPAHSPMAAMVARRALEVAQLDVEAIGSLDIYSCFPCAITTVAEQLGLPTDGSRALTSTGGLPFFGGPGNNYSMHALAEAVGWARRNPDDYAMVTANGGMLSKHASGIYSTRPSIVDWGLQETTVSNESLRQRRVVADPRLGRIVSYTVHFGADGNPYAIMLGETDTGERFVARTAAGDVSTAKWMLANDPTGCSVTVTPADKEKLYFQVAK
ncbi:MAG: hypothetical protein KDI33_03485 [Halioglobus sp.]|nr:hypothetical protein [Halioglobus sp.]